MTISLGRIPSFGPVFSPTGDVPTPAASRGVVFADTFERVGPAADRTELAAKRARAHQQSKVGAVIGGVAAIGLIALFFTNPLVGTAAILLSAIGIIGAAARTSKSSG